MKKKLIILISAVLITCMVLLGCQKKQPDNSKDTGTTDKQTETSVIQVTDSDGKSIEVPKKPKKVVVFDMGMIDTIDALGVGKSVVGLPVSHLPDYLKQYDGVDSVGGIKEPDMEKINALKPDLIIISGRQQSAAKDLSNIAPTLYLSATNEDTWGSTKKNVMTIATIFDKEAEAKKEWQKLEKRREDLAVKAEASGLNALILLVNEGALSAYGPGSRFGIIHDDFGVVPADKDIEASVHGQEVSYEYVLEKDPDIIFVVDRTKAIGGDDSKNQVAENALIKQTKAGKNNKVYTLVPDVWYLSGGGIESTDLMMDDIDKAFE